MSQRYLSGRISLVMAGALAIGSTCAPAQPRSGPAPSAPSGPGGPLGHAGQPLMAPPRPYKLIAVTLPQAYKDPSFEAFRKELGEIASHRDRAALENKVVDKGFFWMGEKGDKASKRKSGIDNLAAAIGLDSQGGEGWEILAAAANEATLEPSPDKKGDVQPGRPGLRPQSRRTDRQGDRHPARGVGISGQGLARRPCRRPTKFSGRREGRLSARSHHS
jgi:hypothetical protein